MTTILAFLFAFAGQQVATPPPEDPKLDIVCVEPPITERAADPRALGPLCASIEGVIVRGVSNTGIAYAKVTLSLYDDPTDSIDTIADASGRFIFSSVTPIVANPMDPREGYQLSASADGFASGGLGQGPPPGDIINLPRGQKRRNVLIRLNTVPTVSGNVHTTDSRGLAAALVRAYRIQYSPVGRRMKVVSRALTNDLGDYRLTGLDPADYYVSASYNEQARLMPLPGVLLTPNLSNPDSGFVTGYYPAVTVASDSTVSTLVAGADKSNLSITLKDTKRFKVHVHVYAGADSLVHHFNVALLPAGADLGDVEDYAVHGKSGDDFDITDIGLGRYSLVAFDKSRILSEPMAITVDHDQEVKIPVVDPLDVPGVIVDEYGNPLSGKWAVRLVRTDRELGQTIHADVDSGNFMMTDIGPGEYDVYVDGLPFGRYIDDVQFPIPDTPRGRFGSIRVTPDKPKRIFDDATQRWVSVPVIRVVVARSSAVVVGWNCNPTFPITCKAGPVVLVPDHRPGNPFQFREDRYVIGRANARGFFRFVGVPPGDYIAFAFDSIRPGLYFDAQFYDRIVASGTSVTATIDKAFELTECVFPPYVDRIYEHRAVIPPPDAACMIRIPASETVGITP